MAHAVYATETLWRPARLLLMGLVLAKAALIMPAQAQGTATQSAPSLQQAPRSSVDDATTTAVGAPIIAAQPKLPTLQLTIVPAAGHPGTAHVFVVEQARTGREQEVGEMFRTAIPANGGMLFDWGTPRESQMWMRNCPVPEDMVFIDPDGTIHRIAENTVPQSMAIVDSGGPVRATLELQGGITERLGITVGDRVQGGPFGGH